MLKTELRKALSIDGVRLEIIVTEMSTGEWSLSVVNDAGIFNNWYEFFPSSQAAFETAIASIEEEGVEAFTDMEGFEYLLEHARQ